MGQRSSQQRGLQPGDQITTNRIVFVYQHHGKFFNVYTLLNLHLIASEKSSGQRRNATILAALPFAVLSGGRVMVSPHGRDDGVHVSFGFRF
ncbi:hypothetical protein Patl1_23220 [Pistacia atlantica]|uniref:Uncharacterized protein n=1 Tax=Pistacia atlantica TaxID=434234 RepID=A0ACC0ZY23_9ROSI|nr:hypothetical protein Patl1_23220 [Pistacia atlantica]